MWPWEHAAVGYLIYSVLTRISDDEPPTSNETGLVLLGTQIPDLVDKPLSWGLGLFPTGYAIGHSAFVAIPVGLFVLWTTTRIHSRRLGLAFVLGYWSHLFADVLTPIRGTGKPLIGRVLWPISRPEPYEVDYGIQRGVVYFREFIATLADSDPTMTVALYVLIPLLTFLVWVRDGTPGADIPGRIIVALHNRIR